MRYLLHTGLLAATVLSFIVGNDGRAEAKGLDQLSQDNPEAAADAGAKEGAPAAAAQAPTATSQALANKLWMAGSAGWLIAKKSSGEWKGGGGMSDITVGYRVMSLAANLGLDATYRYAPMAVSGEEDDHSYRGVWEAHYLGAQATFDLGQGLTAVGSGEVGYVMVSLMPIDGLESEDKHESDGFSMALGGGADWHMFDRGALAVGPRARVGFGSMTTFQLGGSATFVF